MCLLRRQIFFQPTKILRPGYLDLKTILGKPEPKKDKLTTRNRFYILAQKTQPKNLGNHRKYDGNIFQRFLKIISKLFHRKNELQHKLLSNR